MNTLSEIKIEILKSSNSNELNFLISLRAFLIDKEHCPWFLLDNVQQLEFAIEFMHSRDLSYYKNLNTKNIKLKKIYPIDLYKMPKNKRLKLLEIIDDILSSHIPENFLIMDTLRISPFEKDNLMEIIKKYPSTISKNISNIYFKRNNDCQKLIQYSNFKDEIYNNCFQSTFKFKIEKMWSKMWCESKNYNLENDLVNKLIIQEYNR